LAGEDPNRSEFIAPRLTRLIEVAGDLEGSARARWIEFRGFTFEHSAATGGYVALRTPADAAIRLNGAWKCTIANNRFRNIDAYGIWLHLDSCENTIDGNTIEHMGGGGVVLTSARAAYGQVYDLRPAVANYAPLRNRFLRNHIHHGGEVRLCSAGFLLDSRPISTALDPGNLIAFNYVHDMKRQGIFAFQNQGGNVVAYNRFENVVTDSADAGAINFALMNNVTAPLWITHNVVDGVTGLLRQSEGVFEYFAGVGIYLDWGTSHSRVDDNVVSNTRFASVLVNGGSWNWFENNIFRDDSRSLLMTPDGEAIGLGHRFTRNILANTTARSSPLWLLPLEMPRHLAQGTPFVKSDRNLFWNAGGPIALTPAGTLEQWQKAGMDRNSIAADPKFAAATKDVALRPDSPAHALGFRDIDIRNVGPGATIEEKTLAALDPTRLAVAHAIVRYPSGTAPRTAAADANPRFSKSAQYMVYVRFAEKNPNRSVAFSIRHKGGTTRTTLVERLLLGRVPDPRWGIYLGAYDFAAGDGQGVTVTWDAAKQGSMPEEILYVEKKWID
jgi:parallel beta-helix repeat protein